ncbi:MAG TPA: hypothetical protein PKI93_01955 [Alphaproteobacteria bacterium]|nr:hypothetical protein [Alphaproteobacteria bacterium]HNS43934.1 hypothetical protein [Alphaproteobacteria bacterium]
MAGADNSQIKAFQESAEGAEQVCLVCADAQPLGEVVTLGREDQFEGIGQNDHRSSIQSPALAPIRW